MPVIPNLMPAFALTVGLLLVPGATKAQTTILGTGQIKCAEWTTSPLAWDKPVFGFVLGFWSGLNVRNAVRQDVGRSAAIVDTIVGEVRRQCQADPSEYLYAAIIDVYNRWGQAGR